MIFFTHLREFLKSKNLYQRGWWSVELDGWAGGLSGSAKDVDCTVRSSFQEGFSLDDKDDLGDVGKPLSSDSQPFLGSWGDYYELR